MQAYQHVFFNRKVLEKPYVLERPCNAAAVYLVRGHAERVHAVHQY